MDDRETVVSPGDGVVTTNTKTRNSSGVLLEDHPRCSSYVYGNLDDLGVCSDLNPKSHNPTGVGIRHEGDGCCGGRVRLRYAPTFVYTRSGPPARPPER